MLAERYINSSVPVVHVYDSVESTLMWMSLLNVHHLPVTDRTRFCGMIDFDSLEKAKTGTVADVFNRFPPSSENLWVYGNQHIFDALKLANDQRLTVVPVLNTEEQYQGAIILQDLIGSLAEIMNLNEPGDIVVIECNPLQYSLREIASIAESNNAKVLNVYTSALTPDNTIYINLKLSNNQLARVIGDLERFGYKIAFAFSDPTLISDSKDHYDALMSFLNI